MFSFFKAQSIVSETSSAWLEACFAWAAQNFDAETFTQHTRLIEPTNKDFPGRVDSAEAMAATVFGHVLAYSGLQHWPLRLQQQQPGFIEFTPVLLGVDTGHRGHVDSALPAFDGPPLAVIYAPSQCQKPGDLAGYFATTLAQHLMLQAQVAPPGGEEYFAMAAEVIAVFMGFGVLLANSAYSFRGGCGSCYNPAANRPAALSEAEVVHALALFCLYKGLPPQQAGRHLKPHLRSLFKRAYRFIKQHKDLPSHTTTLALTGH